MINKELKIYINTNHAMYSIPRSVIAHDRAKEYQDESPEAYHEEFNFTMEDESVCMDWLFNNTDPEDFHEHFKLEKKFSLPDLINDWQDESVLYIGFEEDF